MKLRKFINGVLTHEETTTAEAGSAEIRQIYNIMGNAYFNDPTEEDLIITFIFDKKEYKVTLTDN